MSSSPSSSSSISPSDAGVDDEYTHLLSDHAAAITTLQHHQTLSKAAYNYWQHAKASVTKHAQQSESQSTSELTFFGDFDSAGDLLRSHAQDAYTAYLEAYHECEKAFDGEFEAKKKLKEFETQRRKCGEAFER